VDFFFLSCFIEAKQNVNLKNSFVAFFAVSLPSTRHILYFNNHVFSKKLSSVLPCTWRSETDYIAEVLQTHYRLYDSARRDVTSWQEGFSRFM
jgi:hypothetical protein